MALAPHGEGKHGLTAGRGTDTVNKICKSIRFFPFLVFINN
jgi:hypothetical protein